MKKGIGMLYFMNGLSMLIVWPVLIATNQVPEIKTHFSYICFHLTAEFVAAVFCMLTGFGLLADKYWAPKIYFLSSGFFIGAGYLAIGYYLFSNLQTGLPMLIILSIMNIWGLTLFLIVMKNNLLIESKNTIKLSLFFSGITIYTLLNIAGFLSEMRTGYTYGYMSMVFILLIYSVLKVKLNVAIFKAHGYPTHKRL